MARLSVVCGSLSGHSADKRVAAVFFFRPSYYTLSLLLLACLVAVPAYAQQRTARVDDAPPDSRGGLAIDEIIVTVSKREESLQEVLGSVSAFNGAILERHNVQSFNDLVQLMPGVVAQDEEKIAIRGVSRTRDGPSPVAFHVNDVFIARRGEPFYDLEAVEVVRGPSGTLFGRNATAGAINVKWKRPDAHWGTGGSLRYSSLEEEQFRAYVNIPFFGDGDRRLLGRVAAMARRSDGTLDNLLLNDDEDPNNINDYFVRLYLTSEPSDNLQLALRAIHYRSRPKGAPMVFSPSLATRRGGTLEELGAQPLPDDLTKVRSRVHERFGDAFENLTRIDGDIVWALQGMPWVGDFDLVLAGGEMRRDVNNTFDLDGTEEAITDGATRVKDDIRRSAELRFVSQNSRGVDWLLGVFWYRHTFRSALDVTARAFVDPSTFGLPLQQPELIVDADVAQRSRTLDNSRAAFLNLNFDLSQLFDGPPVEITTGIRQNRDKFSLRMLSSDISTVDPVFGTPIPIIQERNRKQFADFDETTGELGVRWFYSGESMLYLKASRGYKPGIAQRIDFADGTTVQNPVDPEFLDALEAGWKTAFFQRRLLLNVAGFHYDYRNLQVSQITPGGVLTENAASATIQGLEFELQWSPTTAFFLQGSAAWTDATYDKYCGTDLARENPDQPEPGCSDENPFDFSGARMTAAPRYSAALLASYTWLLSDFGTLTPSVRASWSDAMDRRGLGNPADRIRSHSTSDARLTWESPRQRWKVEAFVENIEDNNDIFFQAFAPVAPGATETYTLFNNLPPRIYGVNLEARF